MHENDGRTRKKSADAKPHDAHPLRHIDPLKAYEWMLTQCAAADQQRQAREDGLVATVTQISSAALLAVPGLMFASDAKLPTFLANPLLYLGLAGFALALASAMLEQYFSARAQTKHVEVMQAYYTFQSTSTADEQSRSRVTLTRRICYSLFCLSVLLTTIGLMRIGV